MKNIYLIFACTLLLIWQGCLHMENTYTVLAPGSWRAVLELDRKDPVANKQGEVREDAIDVTFKEVTEGELPFNFDIRYTDDTTFVIELINAEERIVLEDVSYGRDIRTGRDTILINIPPYESYIKAAFEERVIAGNWVVTNRNERYEIPFIAKQGQDYRFSQLNKTPKIDLTGKWEVDFDILSDEPYKALGEFKQTGNKLTGTFLTETGDYRFLEGTILGDKMYLSCFDGAHAFLFEAKINADQTLTGTFRSGKHYKSGWVAKRNENFVLKDPNSLTFIKEGYDKVEFSFANPDGKLISPDNPEYEGKVKLVQILGTWCPNCRDETEFLIDYLQQNKTDDLAVISLAFEKHKDKSKANAAIRKYKEHFKIPYEMVHAGPSNKKAAAEQLPMLNHVLSYPTLIFIDKKNKVRKIHTGFAGPATSVYADFRKEFKDFVAQLQAE